MLRLPPVYLPTQKGHPWGSTIYRSRSTTWTTICFFCLFWLLTLAAKFLIWVNLIRFHSKRRDIQVIHVIFLLLLLPPWRWLTCASVYRAFHALHSKSRLRYASTFRVFLIKARITLNLERAVQKSHSIVVIIFRDETHHRRISLTM